MPITVLRPSGADRWAYCPASPELEDRYPEVQDSEKAREGTAAHWYVAQSLLGQPPALGALAPNGHPVDAEMAECGQVYLDYCRGWMAKAGPQALIRVETKLTMHGLIHPLNEGTPDFFMVDHTNKVIVVPDFKYGHQPVDVFQRLQNVNYAAGACEGLELGPLDIHDWEVVLAIVQPRNYRADGPVQEWRITGAHLFDLINWLCARAQEVMRPGAPCHTGDWCLDCSANLHCAAFQAVAGRAMELSRSPLAADLSDDALGLQLLLVNRALEKLKAMQSGLEELAESRIKGGNIVPHFAIKSKAGAEKWRDPAAAVTMADAFGFNLRKPPGTQTVLTPTQVRKLPGFPLELLEPAVGYAHRPSSTELTQIDENAARKAFS